MKYFASAVIGCTIAFASTTAMARNATVEAALQARPDLSTFYQGLVSTGVIDELQPGQPYTVFAPTNEAFAKISAAQYPCFYSNECKPQVAAILRNHIVKGEKHVADVSQGDKNREGGTMSVFTISNQHMVISEPNKSHYMVDGRNVLSENQLVGGEIYRIDGVLASGQELASLAAPVIVHVQAQPAPLPPRVPEGQIVTVTKEVATPVDH